ncbi:MAG: enoyl-CoA hydratase/isomerase family protein [Myxococcota bacterium]
MATETLETIEITREDGVDWLTLNRPGSLNAINGQMAKELRAYFWALQDETETRIVVMRGAGTSFCAGLDLRAGGNPVDSEGREPVGRGYGFQGYLADVYVMMRRCPQPIISLVQGNACGGGFAFVLASDVRIAAETARMNAAFIRIGLSACDMGTSYFLPRLVGTSLASELMLTGRFLEADRALARGLVSEVVPEDRLAEAVRPYLDEMLATTPQGLRMTKEGLNMAIDATSLEAAMAIENRNQLMCARTKDFQEGLAAFMEKRPPVYEDR